MSSVANNLGVGIVAALIAGGLFGALLAVFAITFLVNQVVLGVVLNLLALGLTGYLYDALMQNNSRDVQRRPRPARSTRSRCSATSRSSARRCSTRTGSSTRCTCCCIVINVALFRTRWGLRTRAVGEHPSAAADTVGIKVRWTRYRNVILGGMIAGLGGSFLTIGTATAFQKNPIGMTSGKGYIALAALIFGRWSPTGALGAALLFGLRVGAAAAAVRLDAGEHPVRLLAGVALPGHAAGGRRHRRPRGRARPPTASRTPDERASTGRVLRRHAVEAMGHAYAPYSQFPVGAAALVDDGRIVVGCNVENASYGVGLCAECGLVSALHASGGGQLVAFACVDAHGAVLMPCGRCRQLLWEHGGPDLLRRHRRGRPDDGRRAAAGVRAGGPRLTPGTRESFDAVDVIRTKRDGGALADAQIDWVIDAYTRGAVADEQMSALAMAILLDGMTRAPRSPGGRRR